MAAKWLLQSRYNFADINFFISVALPMDYFFI